MRLNKKKVLDIKDIEKSFSEYGKLVVPAELDSHPHVLSDW